MGSRIIGGKKSETTKILSKVWKEADYNDMHELLKTYYEVRSEDDAKELVAEELGISPEELRQQLKRGIKYSEWTAEEDAFVYTCSCNEALNEAQMEFAVAGKYPHRSTAAVARRKKILIPLIERIHALYRPGKSPERLPLIEQQFIDSTNNGGEEWTPAEDKVVINGRKNGEDWTTIEKKLVDKDGESAKKRQKALKKGAAAVQVLEMQKKKRLKMKALELLQY